MPELMKRNTESPAAIVCGVNFAVSGTPALSVAPVVASMTPAVAVAATVMFFVTIPVGIPAAPVEQVAKRP